MALDSAKVNQALLAGRKLLLADDSITIQKVVDLTFGDEGVEVVSVSNGRDAIDRLAEFIPDVVLADVFMPQMNGYEVCEYIKQNEKLKHIPVMLLVGSFEPFDEAEARRVGADDTVTKPFQSIRRLIDKVGSLLGSRPPVEQAPAADVQRPEEVTPAAVQPVEEVTAAALQPAEELIPTAELPKPDLPEPEPELLTEAQIEMATADTQPLPAELRHMIEESAARADSQEGEQVEPETKVNEELMEPQFTDTPTEFSHHPDNADDMLLDLGGFEAERLAETDDFVLDIDLDEAPDASAYQPSAYVRAPAYKAAVRDWKTSGAGSQRLVATADQLADTHEFPQSTHKAQDAERQTTFGQTQSLDKEVEAKSRPADSSFQQVSLQGLSPELIDAIARRAVEQLSEKVVRDIAWEVVPDLAELLIKRQLEEKKS